VVPFPVSVTKFLVADVVPPPFTDKVAVAEAPLPTLREDPSKIKLASELIVLASTEVITLLLDAFV
jgi:hypothetical protein